MIEQTCRLPRCLLRSPRNLSQECLGVLRIDHLPRSRDPAWHPLGLKTRKARAPASTPRTLKLASGRSTHRSLTFLCINEIKNRVQFSFKTYFSFFAFTRQQLFCMGFSARKVLDETIFDEFFSTKRAPAAPKHGKKILFSCFSCYTVLLRVL